MQSSGPEMDMSFFISYDTHDILRQATESTLRYQRGMYYGQLRNLTLS